MCSRTHVHVFVMHVLSQCILGLDVLVLSVCLTDRKTCFWGICELTSGESCFGVWQDVSMHEGMQEEQKKKKRKRIFHTFLTAVANWLQSVLRSPPLKTSSKEWLREVVPGSGVKEPWYSNTLWAWETTGVYPNAPCQGDGETDNCTFGFKLSNKECLSVCCSEW